MVDQYSPDIYTVHNDKNKHGSLEIFVKHHRIKLTTSVSTAKEKIKLKSDAKNGKLRLRLP